MVVTALAWLALATPADFFPARAGAVYQYVESGDFRGTSTDTVLPATTYAGRACMVVRTERPEMGRLTTYYAVEGDTLLLVGQEPGEPYPQPLPIAKFPVGKDTVTWTFTGKVDSSKKPDPINIIGEARLLGSRRVLGRSVDVVEVKLRSIIGESVPVGTEQTSLYARGIGLIEISTSTRLSTKRASKSKVTLKSFVEAPTQ